MLIGTVEIQHLAPQRWCFRWRVESRLSIIAGCHAGSWCLEGIEHFQNVSLGVGLVRILVTLGLID